MSCRKPELSAFLLAASIVMVVAAGSEKPKPLIGTEGKDITLPDKLMGSGSLLWRSPPCEFPTCLRVQNGAVMINSSKVSWNKSTGVIAVKHLQKNDSGQLILEIKSSSNVTRIVYNLTVWMSVAAGSEKPKPLMGTEGKDITLPDKLMGSGSLLWRSPPCEYQTCLRVQNGAVMINSSKVSWNKSTGVIAVKHLQKNDSGQLTLEIKSSSNVTRIVYNLTVFTPTVTPTGNKWLWFLLLLVLVPVLVYGLGYHFGLWERVARFIQAKGNGGSAAGPTTNGYKAGRPTMETEDSRV